MFGLETAMPIQLLWAQFVLVPIVLAVVGLAGQRLLKNSNKAAAASQEAAELVRPNGSGHRSLAHMNEDILMHLGELRGDLKDLHKDFMAHTDDDRENFHEMKQLFELLYDINKGNKRAN